MAKLLYYTSEDGMRQTIGGKQALEYVVIVDEDNPDTEEHRVSGFEFSSMTDIDDVGYMPTDTALFSPC